MGLSWDRMCSWPWMALEVMVVDQEGSLQRKWAIDNPGLASWGA